MEKRGPFQLAPRQLAGTCSTDRSRAGVTPDVCCCARVPRARPAQGPAAEPVLGRLLPAPAAPGMKDRWEGGAEGPQPSGTAEETP